jgi:2,4-dienoyl-CoA reductase-like NADH-dependent reductase (Old Yellow Enzyme family)
MPLLVTPLSIRGVTLRKRIVVSPMCEYSSPDGFATDRHVVHLTGAVGLITEAVQAGTIPAQGQADAIVMARELLRDPYWPVHAARTLGAPVQYLRAY